MNEFEQRKQDRIDRYRGYAVNARQASQAAYDRGNKISSFIPFGQPILVGHHSEKRHRRDIARMHKLADTSLAEHKKAEYWEQRAAAAESNDSISRHDPEAVTKLAERIAELKAKQEEMKLVNVIYRKFKKNPASLDSAKISDSLKTFIRNFVPPYSFQPMPYPAYALQNNNANIRRLEGRMVELQREPAPAAAPVEAAGVTVTENAELDGIEVKFEAKPSANVLAELKSAGFRWSRRQGVWYRRRTEYARLVAARIVASFTS